MAKSKKDGIEKEKAFYSYVVVNRTRRFGFQVILLICYGLIAFVIGRNIMMRENWMTVIFPILLFGAPAMIFPLVEAWDYRPWQAKAQKYERHYRD